MPQRQRRPSLSEGTPGQASPVSSPNAKPSSKSRSAIRAAAVLRLASFAGPSTATDADGEVIPSPGTPIDGRRKRSPSPVTSRSGGHGATRAGTPEGLRSRPRPPDLRGRVTRRYACRGDGESTVSGVREPRLRIKRRQKSAIFDDSNRRFLGNVWPGPDVPDVLGRRPRRRYGVEGLSLRGAPYALNVASHADYQRAFVLDSGLLRRKAAAQRGAHDDQLLGLVVRLREDPEAAAALDMVLEAAPASDSEDEATGKPRTDTGAVLTTRGWGTVDRRLILSNLQTLAGEAAEMIGGREGGDDYEYSDEEGEDTGGDVEGADVQWQRELRRALSFAAAAVRRVSTVADAAPSGVSGLVSPERALSPGGRSDFASPEAKLKLKGRLDRVARGMDAKTTPSPEIQGDGGNDSRDNKKNGTKAGRIGGWFRGVVMGKKEDDNTKPLKMRRPPQATAAVHHTPTSSLSRTLKSVTKSLRLLSESLCAILDIESNTPEESATAVRNLRRAYVALSAVPARDLRLVGGALSSRRGAHSADGDEPETDEEFEPEPVDHWENSGEFEEEEDIEEIIRKKKKAVKHDVMYEKWTIEYTNMMMEFQDNINRITPKHNDGTPATGANDYSEGGSWMKGHRSNDSPAMIRAAFNNADIWEPEELDSILTSVGKGPETRPEDYYGMKTGLDMGADLEAEAVKEGPEDRKLRRKMMNKNAELLQDALGKR